MGQRYAEYFKTTEIAMMVYTVNKLRSLNLHFSSMFSIERKIVHVGVEKIITLYLWQVYVKFEDFSFTFTDAEDYARGEIWRKVSTCSENFALKTSVNVADW
jgi:hypothetical protein